MTDLRTKYLGLNLKNPLVVSAGPLSRQIDDLRKIVRLEPVYEVRCGDLQRVYLLFHARAAVEEPPGVAQGELERFERVIEAYHADRTGHRAGGASAPGRHASDRVLRISHWCCRVGAADDRQRALPEHVL